MHGGHLRARQADAGQYGRLIKERRQAAARTVSYFVGNGDDVPRADVAVPWPHIDSQCRGLTSIRWQSRLRSGPDRLAELIVSRTSVVSAGISATSTQRRLWRRGGRAAVGHQEPQGQDRLPGLAPEETPTASSPSEHWLLGGAAEAAPGRARCAPMAPIGDPVASSAPDTERWSPRSPRHRRRGGDHRGRAQAAEDGRLDHRPARDGAAHAHVLDLMISTAGGGPIRQRVRVLPMWARRRAGRGAAERRAHERRLQLRRGGDRA